MNVDEYETTLELRVEIRERGLATSADEHGEFMERSARSAISKALASEFSHGESTIDVLDSSSRNARTDDDSDGETDEEADE